jgi:REP element-mobilizing transposase RayT
LLITIRDGHLRTGVPTKRTSVIARFVGTFKRFCNKEYGENIWQSRYYDPVIRNQQDYNEIWEYIENNPRKWALTKNI